MGYYVSISGRFTVRDPVGAVKALRHAGLAGENEMLAAAIERSDLGDFETSVTLDSDGTRTVAHVECAGYEKSGREQYLLEVLAPFVAPTVYDEATGTVTDGYLYCDGEDDERWRWVFDGVSLVAQEPTILWPAPPDPTGERVVEFETRIGWSEIVAALPDLLGDLRDEEIRSRLGDRWTGDLIDWELRPVRLERTDLLVAGTATVTVTDDND